MTGSSGSREFEAGGEGKEGKAYEAEQGADNTAHSLEAGATKPTFAQRSKRHCAKWWWLHLLIFCAVFLLIALLVVYVGFPRIAQKGVNDSSLQVTEMDFLSPTPGSIQVTLKAVVYNPSVYTPTLAPFSAALHLIANGIYSPYTMVDLPMPQIHVGKPTVNATVGPSVVSILNSTELAQYATNVVTNENITTTLVGNPTLSLGKLPKITVNYNQSATYKGLNGLKGFNTTGLRLNLSAPAGQPNLRGYAYIPNPSVITVAMGNVTLSLSTASAGIVGNATVENFTLVPGNNTLPMTAIVDQPKIISSIDSKTGLVTLMVKGTSCVYNGQHLSYYETALMSNVLSLQLNVAQVLADSA